MRLPLLALLRKAIPASAEERRTVPVVAGVEDRVSKYLESSPKFGPKFTSAVSGKLPPDICSSPLVTACAQPVASTPQFSLKSWGYSKVAPLMVNGIAKIVLL